MAPARPYRPVSATTSSTMPSPTIAIGNRARNAAEEKRRPPGVRRRSRYGDSTRRTVRERPDSAPPRTPCEDHGVSDATAPYDAFLLLSFGSPEARDDVLPFL